MAEDVSAEPGSPGSPAGPASEVVGRSPREIFWSRFRRDRFAFVGIVFIACLIVMAIAAPWISREVTHHGPNQLFLFTMTDQYGLPKGPSKAFWFGADVAARDLFVRVMYGARTSLIVAFFATGLEMVVGVLLGVVAGFYRGKIDTLISRLMDVVLSLPVLLLALGLVSACGLQDTGCMWGLVKPGLLLVSYVIGLFSWPYIARIVRGQVLTLREREFVEAARAMGASNTRIMLREILPNIVAPIIVYTTLLIPSNILFEASLSFLGIGVPSSVPSWGHELSDASQIFDAAWWTMFFPGMFLLATTLAFNLVGDGLRDAFDPRAAAMSYRRSKRKAERRAGEQTKEAVSTA
ncbi:MAG: ABC transporter permease [Actinobacteria bacterium]|nr:ABC transporter permease [Actinomycetota bacterium]